MSCGFLKHQRAWVALFVFIVAALAVGGYWYTLGQPDTIQPDQKFELQFGRGSGWNGLDLLRITSDGNAVYEYQIEPGEWRRKKFGVGEKEMAELRQAINDLDAWGMARAYHGNVHDGTQWVLLIRIDDKSKSVYFDNHFPRAITRFSDFVDRTILEPLADPLEPEVVPARHHRKHEKEIWASIR